MEGYREWVVRMGQAVFEDAPDGDEVEVEERGAEVARRAVERLRRRGDEEPPEASDRWDAFSAVGGGHQLTPRELEAARADWDTYCAIEARNRALKQSSQAQRDRFWRRVHEDERRRRAAG